MTRQYKCIRCAAVGALAAIVVTSVIVASVRADSGRGVWSSERGSGWISPADARYPDHGYIYEPGDGTMEHIDIEATSPTDYSNWPANPADRYTHPWLRERVR